MQSALDRAGPLARVARDRLPAPVLAALRARAAPVRIAAPGRGAALEPDGDARGLAPALAPVDGPPLSTVVVPTCGGPYLALCLSAIEAFTPRGAVEIVVVDNASPAEARASLAREAACRPELCVVSNERNRGFAAAVNQGARHGTAPVVVVLNDDAIVTPRWLEGLLAHLTPRVGLVGPATNDSGDLATEPADYDSLAGLVAHAACCAERRAGAHRSVGKLSLACAAVPRPVFESVGGLDEGYGLGMFEDDDLCVALRARGLEVRLAGDVWVHHAAGASFRALHPRRYMTAFELGRARFERKWGRRWRPVLPS